MERFRLEQHLNLNVTQAEKLALVEKAALMLLIESRDWEKDRQFQIERFRLEQNVNLKVAEAEKVALVEKAAARSRQGAHWQIKQRWRRSRV
jgi:hypothetical protein